MIREEIKLIEDKRRLSRKYKDLLNDKEILEGFSKNYKYLLETGREFIKEEDAGLVLLTDKRILNKEKIGGFTLFSRNGEDNIEFSYKLDPELKLFLEEHNYGNKEEKRAIGFKGKQRFEEWNYVGYLPYGFDPPYDEFGEGNYEEKIYWEYKAENGIIQVKLQDVKIEYDIFFNKDDENFYSGIPVSIDEMDFIYTYAGRVYYEYSADTEEEEYRFEPARIVELGELKIPDNFDVYEKAREKIEEIKERAKYKEANPEKNEENLKNVEHIATILLNKANKRLAIVNEKLDRLKRRLDEIEAELKTENVRININQNKKANDNDLDR